jgi:diguanylate cyclase (GGDEF)-like protein
VYLVPLSAVGAAVAWVASRAAGSRQALQVSEGRFRGLFESNPHPMWVYDEVSLELLEVNDAAVGHYGYSRDELLGMTILDLQPAEDLGARHVMRDGTVIEVEITSHRLTFAGRPAVVVVAQDVTHRNRMERELLDRAIRDSLTGLGNRVMLADRVAHALQRGTPGSLALLLLDLDGFKTINDSLGHSCGDDLLVAVAGRLRSAVGSADTIARLGGDEFVVLIEDITSVNAATNAAARITRALVAPFSIDGRDVTTSASIGIAVSSTESSYDDLLRNADTAMYHAKHAGRGTHALFEREMHVAAYLRLETQTDLRNAIEHHELVVHYQPIVSLKSPNHVVGVEALVRWRHARRGLIPPLEFIPLAEETGLILEIGRAVLTTACTDVARWNTEHPTRALNVSVNLSARQLADPTLIGDVERILGASGLPPSRLTLEITESVVMGDTERSIAKLHAVKALGVHLAIDDFGTGYSSLAYLRRMPLDVIKIDKTFTDVVPHDVEGTVLVKAILRLADTLNLEAIAEGVENPAQVEALTRFGCPLAQGYCFAKALPLDELATYMNRQRESPAPNGADTVAGSPSSG